MARFYYGKALVHLGRYEEALREFIWCLDMGAQADPSFVGVQSTHLLSALRSLGSTFPAAQTALNDHRRKLERRLLTEQRSTADARMLVTINRLLDPERSVKLFNRMRSNADHRDLALEVWALVIDQLHESGRLQEIADEAATTREWIERIGGADALLHELGSDDSEIARIAGIQYGALLSSADASEARGFASWVVEAHPRVDVFASLIRAARTARDEAEVDRLMSAARTALSDDEWRALERQMQPM